MTTDGGLRIIFQNNIPGFHWQSVETWSTGQGVPDVNFCASSIEGWIEFKKTEAWSVDISPEQVAWIERRLRAGGRVFIAVRRRHGGGSRKGAPEDQLWLFQGKAIRELVTRPIRSLPVGLTLGTWAGGPSRWDWLKIQSILLN